MKFKAFLMSMILFAVSVMTLAAQESRSVSVNEPAAAPQTTSQKEVRQITVTNTDLQNVRQIIADREFYKLRTGTLENEKSEAEKAAANWQNLYEREKYRADVVQENRIKEITSAYDAKAEESKNLAAANLQLRTQHNEDKQYIANADFKIRKLEGDRWIFGLTGAATGTAVGFAGGYWLGNRSSQTTIAFGNEQRGAAGNRLASFQF